MNGRMQDDIMRAIHKTLESYYDDENRWPDIYVCPTLYHRMAEAAAAVFDAAVESSQFTAKEVK
jgi:hypothetical protein